jgi:hypothetical protein
MVVIRAAARAKKNVSLLFQVHLEKLRILRNYLLPTLQTPQVMDKCKVK